MYYYLLDIQILYIYTTCFHLLTSEDVAGTTESAKERTNKSLN